MDDKYNNNSNFDEDDLRELLGEQVREQMGQGLSEEEYQRDQGRRSREESAAARQGYDRGNGPQRRNVRKKKKRTGLKIVLGVLLVLAVAVGITIGTKAGRNAVYTMAGNYIYKEVDRNDEAVLLMEQHNEGEIVGKQEDEVANYLLFGIEEIGGARNTDSMMIASVNQKDGTIKLVSLMRDSYVNIPGWKSTKLNAAYAKGGASLLIQTIEENYKLHIDGYASVNFESFEEIVDSIGKVTIELGEKEAKYLNWANYISKPENRNVKPGINELNGNQLLGYCRVRKVPTLGGANYDYGRTLRHRRAMNAIFEKFKSLNVFKMVSTANKCMGYVTTSMTADQIKDIISVVIENKVTSIDTLRLPVDGMFDDPKSYNGTTYPLIYHWDKNIAALYEFLYEGGSGDAAKDSNE